MAGGGRSSRVYVVSAEYCDDSRIVELAMTRDATVAPSSKPEERTIHVSDRETNAIKFEVGDTTSPYGMHKKRVLRDNQYNGMPILYFQNKVSRPHRQWQVFRGRNEDEKELLFTAKQSKLIGSNGDLCVFLAKSKEEKICDFRVRSTPDICYVKDSHSKTIGKIHKNTVEVYPGVDQAFMISLFIILDGMNQRRVKKREIAKLFVHGCITGVGIGAAFI